MKELPLLPLSPESSVATLPLLTSLLTLLMVAAALVTTPPSLTNPRATGDRFGDAAAAMWLPLPGDCASGCGVGGAAVPLAVIAAVTGVGAVPRVATPDDAS